MEATIIHNFSNYGNHMLFFVYRRFEARDQRPQQGR